MKNGQAQVYDALATSHLTAMRVAQLASYIRQID